MSSLSQLCQVSSPMRSNNSKGSWGDLFRCVMFMCVPGVVQPCLEALGAGSWARSNPHSGVGADRKAPAERKTSSDHKNPVISSRILVLPKVHVRTGVADMWHFYTCLPNQRVSWWSPFLGHSAEFLGQLWQACWNLSQVFWLFLTMFAGFLFFVSRSRPSPVQPSPSLSLSLSFFLSLSLSLSQSALSHTHTHTHTLAQNCHCEFWSGTYLKCKNSPVHLSRVGLWRDPSKIKVGNWLIGNWPFPIEAHAQKSHWQKCYLAGTSGWSVPMSFQPMSSFIGSGLMDEMKMRMKREWKWDENEDEMKIT